MAKALRISVLIVVLVALQLGAVSSALAFAASLHVECLDNFILVQVQSLNPEPPTPAFGGYTVIRYALGTCEEPVMLTAYPVDFTEDLEIYDNPSSLRTPYIYRIEAIDYLGRPGGWVIGSPDFVSISCRGEPIFKGTIIAGSTWVGPAAIECPDSCWMPSWLAARSEVNAIAYGPHPVDLSPYIDTGVPVSLYGELYSHWEMGLGYWVSSAEEATCPSVAADVPEVEPNGWLSQNIPNPFNPQTTIRYHISRKESVQLEVLDIKGRSVAVLKDGIVEAGDHESTWSGRNESGRLMPAGIYFCRLQIGGVVLVKKMALLK